MNRLSMISRKRKKGPNKSPNEITVSVECKDLKNLDEIKSQINQEINRHLRSHK